MISFRYILQPYRGKTTRHICPSCKDSRRTFTRYIDRESKQYLHNSVGRCDREEKCGYHYKPKQFFEDNNLGNTPELRCANHIAPPTLPTSFITEEFVNKSFCNYENNNFVKFLNNRYGTYATQKAVERYLIGTSGHFIGATIFWQKDIDLNFRTGKIMSYNPETCKRSKSAINWVHSIEKLPNFNLKQSLFGEHLLNNATKPIGVVESEKNAILASIHFPELIWLATGSKHNLTVDKCKVLANYRVTLFPDYGAYEDWNIMAQILDFRIDNFIEEYAIKNSKELGFDISDYIIENLNISIE